MSAIPDTYGFTLSKGSVNTVLMFDGFTRSEQYLFAGGKKGVRSSAIESVAHELGHVVGYKPVSPASSKPSSGKAAERLAGMPPPVRVSVFRKHLLFTILIHSG